jgi:hypothetical protein
MLKRRGRSVIGLTTLLAGALALAGCSVGSPSAEQASSKEAAKSEGLLSKMFESSAPVSVPQGTSIHVVLDQTIASNRSRAGDEFEASISQPVVVDGKTVIPKGARVRGRVVEASESGRLSHVASLLLALRSVEVNGKSYALDTTAVGRTGHNHNKRNLEFIGGGAGAGALIGGIAGHGKGALIGAAAGAGAGTAAAAATGKKDIAIPAETPLTFKLVQPVTINVQG